jgi:hypothetical protein
MHNIRRKLSRAAHPTPQTGKSFLLLFFKKEGLLL